MGPVYSAIPQSGHRQECLYERPLVIGGATSIDDSILFDSRERRKRPFCRVHGLHVAVHDQPQDRSVLRTWKINFCHESRVAHCQSESSADLCEPRLLLIARGIITLESWEPKSLGEKRNQSR